MVSVCFSNILTLRYKSDNKSPRLHKNVIYGFLISNNSNSVFSLEIHCDHIFCNLFLYSFKEKEWQYFVALFYNVSVI